MSTTTPQVTLPKVGPASRRFGYVMAILVNAAMLFVANSVLDWSWPPFLTEDFGQVLWLIDLSLLASIAVNSMYLGYDPPWFKSVCQIGLNLITIVVTIRMYQVFPFDFSAYEFNWEMLTRVVMVIGIVGTGIAIVVEFLKLARVAASPK